jgi:Holliday junction resolvasome RuvABC endonuclease subunit
MNFLGLDQAPRNTGWAASSDEEGARVEFGTIAMSDYGDDDQRMMRDFEFEMRGLITRFRPSFIFFEQIIIDMRHVNLPVTYAQFSLVSVIQFVGMQMNIPTEQVLIADWRKRFLGRSNMPKHAGKKGQGREWLKDAAKIECLRRNLLVNNDHEAEAVGILDYGMASKSFDYKWRTKGDVERRRLARAREDMQS